MSDEQRWVKVPGPGQYRGEGEWVKLEEIKTQDEGGPKRPMNATDWLELQMTDYLPVHQGAEPPVDKPAEPT